MLENRLYDIKSRIDYILFFVIEIHHEKGI